jgi:predicted dehydrogenase
MDKWRYHPGVEALAEVARSGELGVLQGIRTTRVQWGSPHEDVDPIWILLPHDLSIVLHVLGTIPTPRAAMFEGTSGAPLGLLGMLDGPVPCAIEVSAGRSEHRRRIDVLCELGVASLTDSDYTEVRIVRTDTGTESRFVSDEAPLLRELRAFVDHLRGGPPPLSSAADGAAVVEAIAQLRLLAGLGSRST